MSIQAHTFVAKGHKPPHRPTLRYFYSKNGLVIETRKGKLAVTLHSYTDAQVLQKMSAGKWGQGSTVVNPDNLLSESVKALIPDTVTLASNKEAEKYLASREAKSSLADELSAAQDADFFKRYGIHRPGSSGAAEAAEAAAPGAGAAAPAPEPEPTTFTVASAQYPKGTQMTLAEVQMAANAGIEADVLNDDGTWTDIRRSGTLKEAGLIIRSASRFEKPPSAPLDADLMAQFKAFMAAQAGQE